jgi:hypothetical protein
MDECLGGLTVKRFPPLDGGDQLTSMRNVFWADISVDATHPNGSNHLRAGLGHSDGLS